MIKTGESSASKRVLFIFSVKPFLTLEKVQKIILTFHKHFLVFRQSVVRGAIFRE